MSRDIRRTELEYVKQPKHARVSFHAAQCQDCGRELRITHVIRRFGGRCRACWSTLHFGVADVEVVS
ncbi:hypothetical protein KDA_36190 [Dictyobacter alpinus]|uniref:Uncharacterized protein n=1 Tax=Dictyobacter alpinus TaxID=2014873 RepID=A0A402B9V5_9CHLR|nr:hypothetical protein [Dictyobacter alpinus]GCE28135.1 hypothetical protein KDA_36190 [Dictyobacter alpinus]